jgi:CelD/BcsL family acetyltransferase involved in cellulose biosynthesis
MLQVPAWFSSLRGEVLGRDALPMLLPFWEDLSSRSVEDNVYYAPRYAKALLDSVEGRDVRFAAVWEGERLMALLPFTRPRMKLPLLQPSVRAWQTPYTYSCTPLLDRSATREAAAALVEVLASISEGEWLIPTVNRDGEACGAILAALQAKAQPWSFSNPFQRAVLEPGSSFDEHMNRHVDSKRRKDLARNRRRLEELGSVGHEAHESGEGLNRAIEAFLAIEASGWKGQRGTALACHEETRKFALGAFTGDAAGSICRADLLTLDGKPIAVSLIVRAGETGFAVKCCYDEAYRKCSAGLLLEVEVIRSFLSECWAGRLDAGTAGTHVIDSLWSGRTEVADLMFSLSTARPEARLAALQRSEQAGRALKAALKQHLERFRPS